MPLLLWKGSSQFVIKITKNHHQSLLGDHQVAPTYPKFMQALQIQSKLMRASVPTRNGYHFQSKRIFFFWQACGNLQKIGGSVLQYICHDVTGLVFASCLIFDDTMVEVMQVQFSRSLRDQLTTEVGLAWDKYSSSWILKRAVTNVCVNICGMNSNEKTHTCTNQWMGINGESFSGGVIHWSICSRSAGAVHCSLSRVLRKGRFGRCLTLQEAAVS